MPLTYIIKGLEYVILGGGSANVFWFSIGALAGFTVISVTIASVVVRRAG